MILEISDTPENDSVTTNYMNWLKCIPMSLWAKIGWPKMWNEKGNEIVEFLGGLEFGPYHRYISTPLSLQVLKSRLPFSKVRLLWWAQHLSIFTPTKNNGVWPTHKSVSWFIHINPGFFRFVTTHFDASPSPVSGGFNKYRVTVRCVQDFLMWRSCSKLKLKSVWRDLGTWLSKHWDNRDNAPLQCSPFFTGERGWSIKFRVKISPDFAKHCGSRLNMAGNWNAWRVAGEAQS
jgi:hypothetical protein